LVAFDVLGLVSSVHSQEVVKMTRVTLTTFLSVVIYYHSARRTWHSLYLLTKVDNFSFSHSRDIIGAPHQNLNGLRDLITTISGMVCHLCARSSCESV